MIRTGLLVVVCFAAPAALGAAEAAEPKPPEIVPGAPTVRPVQLPDGSFRACFCRFGKLFRVDSADGRNWSKPRAEFDLPHKNMGGGLSLLAADGELHLILTHGRGSGRPADTRFIDLWHCRTFDGRKRWGRPKRIWEGYCGAVMDVKQLKNGRIVVPFAAWKKPGETVAPSTGLNYTTVVTSDDGGANWKTSSTRLTSPCHTGYNGNNYGAIEPTILELKDGRVWMLMRTQTGFLYESFSKDGITWSPARPSRFHSSTSPAALIRLPDGRIVVVWNNCEQPPRLGKAGVYGGRDALHAAISADEGKTWRGFREIYRDPRRNETPPRQGDRGTAYPVGIPTRDGKLLISSGQGGRRRMLLVDPEWLTRNTQAETFQHGLNAWHTWKPFGPARRYWRDRTIGPRLVDRPAARPRRALFIGYPDQHGPDCATWNFPAGNKGTVRLRLLLRKNSPGISLALNNRFFNPADPRGDQHSPVRFPIGTENRPPAVQALSAETWHDVGLTWDFAKKTCKLVVDGNVVLRKSVTTKPFGGVSYLRIRSLAKRAGAAGVLIESVRAEVAAP